MRGVALDESGRALSGMGVTAGDFDGDGALDLFRSNFSDERETLYRNRGHGEFDDATQSAGLTHNTRFVGWVAASLISTMTAGKTFCWSTATPIPKSTGSV